MTGMFASAQESADKHELADLRLAGMLGDEGGYSDFFVKLKGHTEFARLSGKHGLDDPAAWKTLRRRFAVNLAELQDSLVEAQSMMETKDQRSGLDDKLISAEAVRERGRAQHARAVEQMEELRLMLRLMKEMEAVLAKATPLTSQTNIQNKSAQGVTAQVLFLDGSDLIIKSAASTYFRVPAEMLNHRTKLNILNEIFADWQELPRIKIDPYAEEGEDRVELIAYNDSRLYIKDSVYGVYSRARSDNERHFVPYATQLESIREALSQADRKDIEIQQSKLDAIEQGRELNQRRLDTIQWYQSRLATKVPSS